MLGYDVCNCSICSAIEGTGERVALASDEANSIGSKHSFATVPRSLMEPDYTSRMKLVPFRTARVVITAMLCAFTGVTEGLQTKQNASQYYAHADLREAASIGADFLGKYMPIPENTVYSDEYIFVEVALFAPPGRRAEVKNQQFKLTVNGKDLAVQPPGAVATTQGFLEMIARPELSVDARTDGGALEIGAQKSRPDPADTPREQPKNTPPPDQASGADGQPGQAEPTQDPGQAVRASVLHEGEYGLPVSGYLCFSFEGKLKKIKHAELVYNGPLGSATLKLK